MAQTERLRIATCQFPVSENIRKNAAYIRRYIKKASDNQADIVHFSETALSGYAGVDIENFDGYDWGLLRLETHEIMALAKKLAIWIVLGSTHFLGRNEKPTNCLYIISNKGEIVDRFDKSMLTGTMTSGDQKYFSHGDHIVTLTLKGNKCGFLICYDGCYPEMYNIYRHAGVNLMFHSFYNARTNTANILDEYVPALIKVRAADNTMWVVANNSSARHSNWPTCIARPDGSMADSLRRHVPGILYHDFPDEKLKGWIHNHKKMGLAQDEVYTNGVPSSHKRAFDRKSLP